MTSMALLRDGACEVLCRHPECFAFRPAMYSTERVHTYVNYCAWRSPSASLHLTRGNELHIADRRSSLVAIAHPLTWVKRLDVSLVDRDHGIVAVTFGDARTSLGPYPVEDAEGLVEAIRQIATPEHAWPVTADELARNPHAYHGTLVRTDGEWHLGLENCRFGNAWSMLPSRRAGYAKVIGLWLADPSTRYGHLGGTRAELLVIEEL